MTVPPSSSGGATPGGRYTPNENTSIPTNATTRHVLKTSQKSASGCVGSMMPPSAHSTSNHRSLQECFRNDERRTSGCDECVCACMPKKQERVGLNARVPYTRTCRRCARQPRRHTRSGNTRQRVQRVHAPPFRRPLGCPATTGAVARCRALATAETRCFGGPSPVTPTANRTARRPHQRWAPTPRAHNIVVDHDDHTGGGDGALSENCDSCRDAELLRRCQQARGAGQTTQHTAHTRRLPATSRASRHPQTTGARKGATGGVRSTRQCVALTQAARARCR